MAQARKMMKETFVNYLLASLFLSNVTILGNRFEETLTAAYTQTSLVS